MDAANTGYDKTVLRGIISLVYFVVGLVVANSHHYFAHLNAIKPIASAILAVLLWPLLLVGVNLHI